MKRVVVTGMGAVTPIGITVEKFWESVLEGKVGIGPIQNFDTTQYKAKLSAEVIDFDPKAYIEPKAAKRMDTSAYSPIGLGKYGSSQCRYVSWLSGKMH